MSCEKRIIEGCIKNDKRWQKVLYDNYASVLLGVAIRYAYSRDDAEDILQDAFCKIYSNIAQFKGTGSFEGWLKRIVVNTALTHYKRNEKHYHNIDVADFADVIPSSNQIAETEFQMSELLKIINGLPKGYRMVFNMYAIEGYKHKEIAEILGIDENTSKSQFSRARRIVKEKLAKMSITKESDTEANNEG